MNRFYVPKENIGKDDIRIFSADDIHHLRHVLRIRPGEEVFVTDGDGAGYLAVLEQAESSVCVLKIRKLLAKKTREELPWRLSLAVAVPKKACFEEVIDKGTQLGVDEFIPLVTERSLVSLDQVSRKMERYRRVLTAAAHQSGVLFLPVLKEPQTFAAFLKMSASYEMRLLPNLTEKSLTVASVFRSFSRGRIAACVGPEGDFSPREIEQASGSGFHMISLGDSVLRVDTAAIALAASLRLFLP